MSGRTDAVVLLNPQFDYKKRTIDTRLYWTNDVINDDAGRELNGTGTIQFTPTLKHGRPLLNEVFWLKPNEVLGEIETPTLIVHGNADTLVPIDGSRAAVAQFTAPVELVEIDGSQHGFAVHDDPQYLAPRARSTKPKSSASWRSGYGIRTSLSIRTLGRLRHGSSAR